MKKMRKEILIVLTVIMICAAGFWYFEGTFPLTDILPDEEWTDVEVYAGNVGSDRLEVSPETVLAAIDGTTVDRGQEFHSMPLPLYSILLVVDGEAPTLIYVLEDGRISVAVELDAEHYQHFAGGKELYAALMELTS